MLAVIKAETAVCSLYSLAELVALIHVMHHAAQWNLSTLHIIMNDT